MKKENTDKFIVVGIGASEEGTKDLEKIFEQVKPSNIAYIIIQQKSSNKKSTTKEVLKKITDLPLEDISSNTKIIPGKIYFSPSDEVVTVDGDTFDIQTSKSSPQKHSTIDWLFNSIATNYKYNAVGILLSGEGIDGTMGLKAISEAGGLTIAQDINTSEQENTPVSAIEAGFVDHVVGPGEIPRILEVYEKFLGRMGRPENLTHLREEIGAALIEICDLLYKHTHHDFKHYKTSTLVRRILRRMQVLQLNHVEAYVEVLQDEVRERDNLFHDLLINVTSFFRDPEAFEVLKRDVIIPGLKLKPVNQKYRVWVAGCSTGEEAYTLAILIREALDEQNLTTEVQIIATDIDEDALNTARKGEYSLAVAERITRDRLDKFFVKKSGRLVVSKVLREMCLFSSHNLINDPPFSQLDLISCRNVLIYLGLHLQKKLIPVFHYALRPNGYLFLGTSEALSSHKELFQTENAKFRIAQRKSTAINLPINSFFSTMATTYSGHFQEAPKNQEEDLHLIGQRILLDEFAPKYAIVGDDFQILSVSAGIGAYLEPNEGLFHNNLVKLVKQNLRAPLRSALNEAKKHKRQIEHHSAIVKMDLGMHRIGIVVQPMPQLGGQSALFMVVFKDQGIILDETKESQSSTIDVEMVEELEKELASLREDLDKTVQDLEASNEELKSSNEELLSMNEELQSANEELETSKEEIQFVNDTLQRSNVDLENLLHSTKIATIFLDDKLNIVNFTPAVNEIYDLLPQDLGRPLNNFASKALRMPPYTIPKNLEPDQVIETEVIMPDGRVFLRRKSAYLNSDHKQVGLVITFVDVTELRLSEGIFKTLANSVPGLIWVTDHQGNYVYFSEQWLEFSGIDPEVIRNKGFRDIVHPDDIEGVIELWTLSHKTGRDFSHEYRLKDKFGVYHWHLVKARPMFDHSGKIFRWFGSCTNIQPQKKLELSLMNSIEKLKESEFRYSLASRATRETIWDWNLENNEVHWNESLTREMGYPAALQSSTSQWWYDHIHPEDRERTVHSIHKVIDNGGTYWQGEYRFIKASGEYADILDQGYIRHENGKPIRMIGSMQDVTERKKYLDEVHNAIHARDEFLSIASHELKTPVTSMQLHMQMLQRRIDKGEHEKINLNDISRMAQLGLKQCRYLTSLIDDMLDVSRIATGRMNFNFMPIQLEEIVKNAVDSFSINLNEKNVVLETSFSSNVIIKADSSRMEQVVYNLLNNALKYGEGRPIKLEVYDDKNHGYIKVTDQGLGISPENLARIFERFERAISATSISGLGLGLFISREILNAHGGDISVTSELGKGSQFIVKIPSL